MSARPNLRVLDGDGEVTVREDLTPILSETAALVEELVDLRRKLSATRGELTKLRKADPKREVICDILEHWKQRTGHLGAQVPVDGKRFKVVKARLNDGYTPDQLKRAIDGVAAFPYEGEYGKRYAEKAKGRKQKDDLALHIMCDEVQVDKRIRLAEADWSYETYRTWLYEQCQAKPNLRHALAFLASEHTPHGSVLASAALWAKHQQGGA